MTYWIQHGHGKADKIQRIAQTGLLSGVILSPANEDLRALSNTVDMLRDFSIEPLIDPQLSIHVVDDLLTLKPAILRRRDSHGLNFGLIRLPLSEDDIRMQVEAVIEANERLGLTRVVAPSPYMSSFGDAWAEYSLKYLEATIEMTERPVLASLVTADASFADWELTQDYLDAITSLDIRGVYLIVGTSDVSYPVIWNAGRLTNVLRVIYSLSEFNNLDVVWGYSDVAGVLGVICGAEGAATGWHNSLRMWHVDRWKQRPGRQAKVRMFSAPLMSSIERVGEAASIARTASGRRIFPAPRIRQELLDEVPWTRPASQYQHLRSLAKLHASIDLEASMSDRVMNFRQQLVDARALFASAREAGAAVGTQYVSQLNSLVRAIDQFVAEEEL